MSLLVIHKVLGLFVSTLIANNKYSLLDRDNLRQPIAMQLSNIHDKYSLLKKDNLRQPIAMQLSNIQQTISHFFRTFLKSRSNFERFKKKMTLIG